MKWLDGILNPIAVCYSNEVFEQNATFTTSSRSGEIMKFHGSSYEVITAKQHAIEQIQEQPFYGGPA